MSNQQGQIPSNKAKWEEPARERAGLSDLPGSQDEEFWGDAEKESISEDEIEMRRPKLGAHTLKRHGSYAICISCPFEHTVNIDLREYDIIDGKPVRISLDKSADKAL